MAEQSIAAKWRIDRSDFWKPILPPLAEWRRSSHQNMTPLGYIAKRIVKRPDWLAVPSVGSIYSVANCISEDFTDYVTFWKHNGFWLFDEPGIIAQICVENAIDQTGLKFIYLESDLTQYDTNRKRWMEVRPESSFETNVVKPIATRLRGFDVVTYSCGNTPEHSPLSCNHVASEVPVNKYCLIDNAEEARDHIARGVFDNSEPGPLRVVAVHEVEIGTNNAMHPSRGSAVS